jgi:hypothetical protein
MLDSWHEACYVGCVSILAYSNEVSMRKFLLASVFVALAGSAKADVVWDFLPANSFSGTPATGNLTATFHTVAPGTVTLQILSNLNGGVHGEFVLPGDGFYFNLNPAKNPAALIFSLTSNVGFSQAAVLHTGIDAFKPDGDGKMDIELTWSPSTKAFTAGQSQTYTITGISGLVADDFSFLSNCDRGCGSGAHYNAFHIGNTGNDDDEKEGSDWVGGSLHAVSTPPINPPSGSGSTPVREPATLVILGLGMASLGMIRRKA